MYSHLVPAPHPGAVRINGLRLRAEWRVEGGHAKITARVTGEQAEKLLEDPLGQDPVMVELYRGEELVVAGEGWIDATLFDGRLELQVRFATYRS